MYASDFSRASLAALPHAIDVAKASNAELLILHVLPSPLPEPVFGEVSYIDQAAWDRLLAEAGEQAHKQLEPLLLTAREARVQTDFFIVYGVDPTSAAGDIVRAAIDKKVDMLVLGTHGRTGIAKFFLGSVAARVLAAAPCPVLTVRASADNTLPPMTKHRSRATHASHQMGERYRRGVMMKRGEQRLTARPFQDRASRRATTDIARSSHRHRRDPTRRRGGRSADRRAPQAPPRDRSRVQADEGVRARRPFGALDEGGRATIDSEAVARLQVGADDIASITAQIEAEMRRRATLYKAPPLAHYLPGMDVVLVDDGLATGLTMRAAVHYVRRLGAREVTVAVPCASEAAAVRFRDDADRFVSLIVGDVLGAVGGYYADFATLTDEQVCAMIIRANADRP
jgi:nucleotide-binding universal stress UspA family protein